MGQGGASKEGGGFRQLDVSVPTQPSPPPGIRNVDNKVQKILELLQTKPRKLAPRGEVEEGGWGFGFSPSSSPRGGICLTVGLFPSPESPPQ